MKLSCQLYHPHEAEIVAVTPLTPSEKLFRMQLSGGAELGHLPGQFLQLSIPGFGEAPISIASAPTRQGSFDLGIRRVGSLTTAMHARNARDLVGIRGPFGNPFNISSMQGKDLLLISGGCGIAPLRSLIQYCEDRPAEFGRVTILYGARNPGAILFKEDFSQWDSLPLFTCNITVDSNTGSDCYSGNTGLITALIPPLDLDPARTEAVIVGPPVMYPPVIAELKKKGLTAGQIVVSLERQMRCGVGKCGHCSIEHLYCCQDGPVFRLSDIEHLRGAL
jgi:NAD(P)H-flavin reductase